MPSPLHAANNVCELHLVYSSPTVIDMNKKTLPAQVIEHTWTCSQNIPNLNPKPSPKCNIKLLCHSKS